MKQNRRGFTLIESVVTVGLIAVMASFVVPTVMRKADAADPVKIASDLNAVANAVQQFASDVKTVMPGDIEDLVEPPLTNASCSTLNPCDSSITHTQVYTVEQAALWKGPYLTASISADPKALLRSGYVADFANPLVRFDSFSGLPEFCPTAAGTTAPCSGFVATNPLFVAVRVGGLSRQQALSVNTLIDGPHEVHPGLEGRFRFPSGSGPTGASPAYFLAAPIAPEQ